MLHFQNMRKKFFQHPDQIPFLQKFRMDPWRSSQKA